MQEAHVAFMLPSTPMMLPDKLDPILRTILETRVHIAWEGRSGMGLAGREALGLAWGLCFLAPLPFLRFLFFDATDGPPLVAGAGAAPERVLRRRGASTSSSGATPPPAEEAVTTPRVGQEAEATTIGWSGATVGVRFTAEVFCVAAPPRAPVLQKRGLWERPQVYVKQQDISINATLISIN